MLRDKLKQFTDGNPDNMKISNMWKVFKNLGSNKIGKSYAKVNHDGKILTGKDKITEALRIEISERMRDRPIRDDLRDVDILENLLIDLKMEIAKGIESAPVSVGELEFVLNNLRLGKARDHQGYAARLFRRENLGSDLKLAILEFINRVKKELIPSQSMNEVRVSCIPKPGSTKNIRNLKKLRGIFNVSIFREILMKILYNRNYYKIESKLSEYNVGARKDKNCLINVFIIHAIIIDILSDPTKSSINIQCLDYTQFFDSLKLKKSLLELIETGIDNDEIILIYNANKEVIMAVKNGDDLSKKSKVTNVILQGDTLALLIATVDMDGIAKQWLERASEQVYKYKNNIPVGSLGVIDDLLMITKVGVQTTKANAFVNTMTAIKGWQFGEPKCSNMMVKNEANDCLSNVIKLDRRKEERKYSKLVERQEDKMVLKEVDKQKYIGVYIQNDGKNTATINEK